MEHLETAESTNDLHGNPSNDIYEPWIKWGKAFLIFELSLAIIQTLYSLYMALTGSL